MRTKHSGCLRTVGGVRCPVLAAQQTEDEALAEDEAGVAPSETVMNVPRDLVPKVRELIAKHRS